MLEGGADDQRDVIANEGHIGLHAEITALDQPARLKPGGIFTIQNIHPGGVELHRQGQRPGHAVKGQLTGNARGISTGAGDMTGFELDFGILRGIEPFRALQFAVQLGIGGGDAGIVLAGDAAGVFEL